MAWKIIKTYSISWNITKKSGGIGLELEDGSSQGINVSSAEELSALVDILRGEKNVNFNTDANTIETTRKPPGDAL